MFNWFFKNKVSELEKKTESGFKAVRGDMDSVGKWIKHLDKKDKQVFDIINDIKDELSTIRDEINGLREGLSIVGETGVGKQALKNNAVLRKQTAILAVQEPVQTAVQTGSFYEIFKNLSSNERSVLFTLMNSDMKLSYEDLALLLGKERSTIRGQINAIKQKSEGIIEEIVEKNGKKRVYVPDEVRVKLSKYAKVRVKGVKKRQKDDEN